MPFVSLFALEWAIERFKSSRGRSKSKATAFCNDSDVNHTFACNPITAFANYERELSIGLHLDCLATAVVFK